MYTIEASYYNKLENIRVANFHVIHFMLRWHSCLSAKVNKNANLGYSHDRGLS